MTAACKTGGDVMPVTQELVVEVVAVAGNFPSTTWVVEVMTVKTM